MKYETKKPNLSRRLIHAPYFRTHERGFSLLELLMVVAILAILGSVVLRSLSQFRGSSTTDASLREIVSLLRLAKSRTLAAENRIQYGVHFQSDRAVLFVGAAYDAASPANQTNLMPSGVTISTIALAGGGADMVFDRLTGRTANSGTVTLTGPNGTSRTITIDGSGEARGEAAALNPTGSARISDARHVNFQLGWSIQNATTLRLAFSNPALTEDIDASGYFNADKSSFDWSGTVSVGGAGQTLRIHTTQLSASDTTLSIHRDGTKNSKALTVSFIDGGITKAVASYSALGVLTTGAYGGTATIQ